VLATGQHLRHTLENLRFNEPHPLNLRFCWHDFIKKLERLGPRLDLASTEKRRQPLAFANDRKNDPAKGL
jgi:hypothetical protein